MSRSGPLTRSRNLADWSCGAAASVQPGQKHRPLTVRLLARRARVSPQAFEESGVSVISANVVALCPTGVREFYEETDKEHRRQVAFQVARELARRHRVVPPIVTGG